MNSSPFVPQKMSRIGAKRHTKVQMGMCRPTPTSECLTFVRRKDRYHPAKQTNLKNSLLAGVGFLELANAMDFAANVWNTIPVPLFAAILMGVGGTVALAISLYAFRDAQLSWRNVVLLQDERRYLKEQEAHVAQENIAQAFQLAQSGQEKESMAPHSGQTGQKMDTEPSQLATPGHETETEVIQLALPVQEKGTETYQKALSIQEQGTDTPKSTHSVKEEDTERDLACQLDVSFREIGTEMIDRVGMDLFMGFGAILVAVGTYMAIGGADRRVYRASNLLSGYIGNAPSAFYGAFNAMWSVYVWRRAHRHGIAGSQKLKAKDVEILQRDRIKTIKTHATLNGLTGIIAGIAGLITATMWQGYVALVPCIVSAIYCNYIWRKKVGYERPSILQSPSVESPLSIVEEIQLAALAQRLLKETPVKAFGTIVSEPESFSCVMDFIVMNGFFEDFCIRILRDLDLTIALFGSLPQELDIDSRNLLTAERPSIHRLFEIAETCVVETGPAKFQARERFLLERLGCYLCIAGSTDDSERDIASGVELQNLSTQGTSQVSQPDP